MRLSNLTKVYLLLIVANAGEGIVSSLMPPYLKASGQEATSIGFIVATATVASLISRLPAGLAYKPHTQNVMMRVCLGMFVLAAVLYPMANDVASLTVLRIATGLSHGAATTLNLAVLMDLISSSSSRARTMAFYTAAMSAGFAIGNSAGGWFVDSFGYAWAFRLAAVGPMLGMFLTVKLPQPEAGARTGGPVHLGRLAQTRAGLRYVLDSPVLIIALLTFSLNSIHQQAYTFFPIYAMGVGLSLTSIGLLRGLHSLFGAVTRPVSGEVTRIASTDLLANGGLVFVALLIVLIPSFDSMTVFIPLFIALGVARGIVMVSNTISLVGAAGNDPRKKGMASGMLYTAADLGNIFGPIFGGVVAGLTSIETMLRVGPLIVIAAYFIALAAFLRWQARRRVSQATELAELEASKR